MKSVVEMAYFSAESSFDVGLDQSAHRLSVRDVFGLMFIEEGLHGGPASIHQQAEALIAHIEFHGVVAARGQMTDIVGV